MCVQLLGNFSPHQGVYDLAGHAYIFDIEMVENSSGGFSGAKQSSPILKYLGAYAVL